MATMYNPPHLGEFHSHYRSLDDRLHRRGKAHTRSVVPLRLPNCPP